MDYKLSTKDAAVIAEGSQPKTDPLILRIDEGEAFLQLEITQSELRLTGDGGATRAGTWEVELAVPRVKER